MLGVDRGVWHEPIPLLMWLFQKGEDRLRQTTAVVMVTAYHKSVTFNEQQTANPEVVFFFSLARVFSDAVTGFFNKDSSCP